MGTEKLREFYEILPKAILSELKTHLSGLGLELPEDWTGKTKEINQNYFYYLKSKDGRLITSNIASVFLKGKYSGDQLEHALLWNFSATFPTLQPGKVLRITLCETRHYQTVAVMVDTLYSFEVLYFNQSLIFQNQKHIKDYINANWVPLSETSLKNASTVDKTQFFDGPCSREIEKDSCNEALVKAYKIVLLPFFFSDKLGEVSSKFRFGQFVSYFSRLVSHSKDGQFLKNKTVSSKEEIVESHLLDIWSRMTKTNQSNGISVFELPNLLEPPSSLINLGLLSYDVKECIVPRLQEKKGCDIKKYSQAWTQFLELQSPPCSNITQAQEQGIERCCAMSEGLNQFMLQIYKVMKYAHQPPHAVESDEEFLATFSDPSVLGFTTMDLNQTEARYVTNPAIPMCQYAGDPIEMSLKNCQELQRSITNTGFGYSSNTVDFWALYQETDFTRTFSKIMIPKGHNKPAVDMGWKPLPDIKIKAKGLYKLGGIRTPETSGKTNTLTLILESPKIYDHYKYERFKKDKDLFKKVNNGFKVSIHDPFSVPDFR